MLLSLLGVSEKIVFMIFLCAKNNKLETNSEIQEVPFKFLLINDLLALIHSVSYYIFCMKFLKESSSASKVIFFNRGSKI